MASLFFLLPCLGSGGLGFTFGTLTKITYESFECNILSAKYYYPSLLLVFPISYCFTKRILGGYELDANDSLKPFIELVSVGCAISFIGGLFLGRTLTYTQLYALGMICNIGFRLSV